MKRMGLVFMLGSLAVGSASSQQPTGVAASAASGPKQVRRVLAPPKEATVQGAAARSTAQTMAARAEEPLLHVPAFGVTDIRGQAADINSVRPAGDPAGHWLLLYRPERCAVCDKVLAALAASDSPLFKQGASLVVVVKPNGGAATDGIGILDKMKSAYPSLANAAWVQDADGAAFAALKPHGEPVLYAVSGNDIGWTVHGSMNDPAALERLAHTWLASTAKPRSAVASSNAGASSAATTGAAAAKATAARAKSSPLR